MIIMAIRDISGQHPSGSAPSGASEKNINPEVGSDGVRLIAPKDNRKLLPLQQALNSRETSIGEREIRTLIQALNSSVEQSDLTPLMSWFEQHKVEEILPQNLMPADKKRSKNTPLKQRNIEKIHEANIAQLAMQLIRYHLKPRTQKDASGTTSASAKVSPALENISRRKDNKNSDGDSNFIANSANTGLKTVDRKEVEEGLDSIRITPRRLN